MYLESVFLNKPEHLPAIFLTSHIFSGITILRPGLILDGFWQFDPQFLILLEYALSESKNQLIFF